MTGRFDRGESIVWRSQTHPGPGYTLTGRVLVDDGELVLFYEPIGAPTMRRIGARGGPNGRQMLPDGWSGEHEPIAYGGPSTVRAYEWGSMYSVIRRWTPTGCAGWYVNLESPWTRTAIGFDSRDLILDVVFDDELDRWSWKDSDELDWAVEVGLETADQASAARLAGEQAIDDALHRRGVFGIEWNDHAPDPEWSLPVLPPTWAD